MNRPSVSATLVALAASLWLPLVPVHGLAAAEGEAPLGAAGVQRLDPALLDERTRAPDTSFAYKQAGGVDLPMAVFLPHDRASLGERRPAVLCLHGGAWSGWRGGDCSTWDGGIFAPQARYFAARGAVAVAVSYRNLIQPNKDKAGFEAGPSLFDLYADCRSAVRYLRQHADRFGIDPARIAVIGDSAGGHLAACLGTVQRFDEPGEDPAVKATADLVVACNPITDLTDPAWAPWVHGTPRAWEGTAPVSQEERAKAISPLWNVSASSAPTLVIHGLKDAVVLPRHAADLHQALQKAGVSSVSHTIPDASHAFVLVGYRSTGSEILAVMRTIDGFLAANGYLRGEGILASSATQGHLTTMALDRIEEGRIPGSEGLALVVPDARKAGVTTVAVMDDGVRGRVLKVGKGSEGLVLSGQRNLGTAATVSLWVNPDKTAGTLVRRSVGTSTATGYVLAMGKGGELTWKAAGVTLTAPALPTRTWSHVVATVVADRTALYVDDRLIAEQPLSGAVLIGSQVVVGEGYAGLLSDLRLYDGANR